MAEDAAPDGPVAPPQSLPDADAWADLATRGPSSYAAGCMAGCGVLALLAALFLVWNAIALKDLFRFLDLVGGGDGSGGSLGAFLVIGIVLGIVGFVLLANARARWH